MRLLATLILLLPLLGCPNAPAPAPAPSQTPETGPVPVETFLELFERDEAVFAAALTRIGREWQPSYSVMLVELLRVYSDARRAQRVANVLQQRTGRQFQTLEGWWVWIWETRADLHPDYLSFKRRLYQGVDSSLGRYFDARTTIRLDEIRWGGVVRDGIPPLNDPATVTADEATYLDDGDVVFGVALGGEARAYPKRILAWHEMVKDTLGGESICGVYCTLCGTMIVYETELDGAHHELGTSGFLYRSNKLMYDHATESLWSTLEGKPVMGPLVGKGLQLTPRWVVTTTWGAWRRRHPATTVLSLETGHERDYDEGVAYRDYFATDALMFGIPGGPDERLANKAEVLAIRVGDEPLAISAAFLEDNVVFSGQTGEVNYVVLTDPSGANRVYDSASRVFVSYDGERAVDDQGRAWEVGEAELSADDERLARLPAHRAFWFGWRAAFPKTRLIKE